MCYKFMEMVSPVRKDLLRYKRFNHKLFSGFKFSFTGRFKRRNRSQNFCFTNGSVSLNTFSKFIEYANLIIVLRNSSISIRVWLARDFKFYQNIGYQMSKKKIFYEKTN